MHIWNVNIMNSNVIYITAKKVSDFTEIHPRGIRFLLNIIKSRLVTYLVVIRFGYVASRCSNNLINGGFRCFNFDRFVPGADRLARGLLDGWWRVEVFGSKVGGVVVSSFDSYEATVHRRLNSAQAAFGVLIATRPVQFLSIMIVHPKLIVPENQHWLPRSRWQEKCLWKIQTGLVTYIAYLTCHEILMILG